MNFTTSVLWILWINEIDIVNLRSWNRLVQYRNSWSWNHEVENYVTMLKSWIIELGNVAIHDPTYSSVLFHFFFQIYVTIEITGCVCWGIKLVYIIMILTTVNMLRFINLAFLLFELSQNLTYILFSFLSVITVTISDEENDVHNIHVLFMFCSYGPLST